MLLRDVLLAALLAALAPPAAAYQSYQGRVPNGNKIRDGNNDPWPGVGHKARNGGGPRNAFGSDFDAAGKSWTSSLCRKDSDGDGLTNGQELGDPDCKWSPGATPQFDTGLSHPGLASYNEVEREVESCSAAYEVPPASAADSAVLNLTFAPYAVPTQHTTYAKYAFNLQDEIAALGLNTAGGDYFGIRFSIINKHPNVVHHLILYACGSQPDGISTSTPGETDNMPCDSLRYAWAVGGKDFCLPPSVGISFPAADRGAAWHAMEIHYDNPQGLAGISDTSGLSIQLVRKKTVGVSNAVLADYIPAGFLWSGSTFRPMRIPPGQDVFHYQTECDYPQIPDDGITLFAYLNHAHLLGRKIWTTMGRGGKYVRDVGCDTAYDFDLQSLLPFSEKVVLKRDDVLKTNCVYDSTARTQVTRGGDETNNEMCIAFLVYYPEVPNLRRCLVPPTQIQGEPAGQHQCCSRAAGCEDPYYDTGGFGAPGWLVAHVALMVVGWLVVLPVGIYIAALGRKTCGNGRWFRMHRGLQVGGLLLATGGAVAAMANLPSHADSNHKSLGLAVMALAWLQPLNGFLRPHAPDPGVPRARARKLWEFGHKNLGRLVLLLAFVNVALGAQAAKAMYMQPRMATAAWACFGLSVVVLLGVVAVRVRRRACESVNPYPPPKADPAPAIAMT